MTKLFRVVFKSFSISLDLEMAAMAKAWSIARASHRDNGSVLQAPWNIEAIASHIHIVRYTYICNKYIIYISILDKSMMPHFNQIIFSYLFILFGTFISSNCMLVLERPPSTISWWISGSTGPTCTVKHQTHQPGPVRLNFHTLMKAQQCSTCALDFPQRSAKCNNFWLECFLIFLVSLPLKLETSWNRL